MKTPITQISFDEKGLKQLGYTRQQFIDEFSKTYPDADLGKYADDMGLVGGPTVEETAGTFKPLPEATGTEKISTPAGGATGKGSEKKGTLPPDQDTK